MPRPGTVTASQIRELIEKQGYRCAISGRELTPETASLDHIVPLSQGGAHTVENLWVVDHQINAAKGTLSFEDFLTMCQDVVAHQQELDHPLVAGVLPKI